LPKSFNLSFAFCHVDLSVTVACTTGTSLCSSHYQRHFYVRKQLLLSARLSHRNSVRPSVCLSHGWIRQKRSKLGSPNLYPRLPGRL